jgi:uncharacterized membrane protein YphA (DoxX/SURF4 family)
MAALHFGLTPPESGLLRKQKAGFELKAKKMLYWATTSLVALETLLGGVVDLTHGRTGVVSGPLVTQVVTSLGYPLYILAIVGVFKIPGAVTIVVPGLLRLKEWAYAGIVFELSGAVASHVACGEWGDSIAPLSLLCLAIASWGLRPASRTLGALFPADGHKRNRSNAAASIWK